MPRSVAQLYNTVVIYKDKLTVCLADATSDYLQVTAPDARTLHALCNQVAKSGILLASSVTAQALSQERQQYSVCSILEAEDTRYQL